MQIGNAWIGITGLSDRSEWDVYVGTLTVCNKLNFINVDSVTVLE